MIKAVVFDLGGVLIDWKREHLYEQVFQDKEKMDWFLDNVCTWEWNENHDDGTPHAFGVELKVREFPEYEYEIKMFYDRFDEMIRGVFPNTENVLYQLKASGKYKLYALSNWSHETFPTTRNKFQFLNEFDALVISGDEKVRKPYKPIYQIITNRYDLKANEIVFIDDRQGNLDTANLLGWNTILFTPQLDLNKALNELGVDF